MTGSASAIGDLALVGPITGGLSVLLGFLLWHIARITNCQGSGIRGPARAQPGITWRRALPNPWLLGSAKTQAKSSLWINVKAR